MPYSANTRVGELPVKLSDEDWGLFNGFCKRAVLDLGVTVDGSDEFWQIMSEYIDRECNDKRCDLLIRAYGFKCAVENGKKHHTLEELKAMTKEQRFRVYLNASVKQHITSPDFEEDYPELF